jgi:putative transcriptional regulator
LIVKDVGNNMISYHPDSRFLTDFASANLSVAEAVCVSAHLEFCGKCRGHVQQLKDVGAHLLAQLPPEELEADSFAQLMSKISSAGQASPAPTASSSELEQNDAAPRQDSTRGLADVVLPRSLRGLCGDGLKGLSWAQLGKALRIAPLPILGESHETAIYDIKAGERMPEHEHRGEEITVLLKGSFSDAEGSYSRGDFVVRNAGETHQPTATQDTDCICLVCLERPVRPRGLFYRLIEPIVQYRLHKLNRSAAY